MVATVSKPAVLPDVENYQPKVKVRVIGEQVPQAFKGQEGIIQSTFLTKRPVGAVDVSMWVFETVNGTHKMFWTTVELLVTDIEVLPEVPDVQDY